jgi:threonine/homoserine efflux transporter RhtA
LGVAVVNFRRLHHFAWIGLATLGLTLLLPLGESMNNLDAVGVGFALPAVGRSTSRSAGMLRKCARATVADSTRAILAAPSERTDRQDEKTHIGEDCANVTTPPTH